ncbi:OPT oligopeptide transporter protein-domain-containing protein [Hygrophoropsis aurantiaca]|uniref:OPT oligopeptide transporter protein-domain-containing protein n=1 Tax=Hygrophoropsis aurantiaca TaxID=72124 RepID=A0ACB8ASR9_9AGAM|nr:OPT oligopeptide transporter protein-domain-containing protein [Hygrophoropsis aurantiaca]
MAAPPLSPVESLPPYYAFSSAERQIDDVKVISNKESKALDEYSSESGQEPSEGSDEIVRGAEDIATLIISSEDTPQLPALTFRFWFLGIGLATFGSVLSEIYYWKPQGATVSALFQLIIAYVLGNAMHYIMPSRGFWRYLNPGPFNIKEHTCITIMASTASNTATAVGIIATLDLFYGVELNPGAAIFQTFASQVIGYGFAGILRTLLVWPTYALYPSALPSISLLQSMHFGGLLNHKKMKYFWMVFGAIFCWEIVPTWMFPLLTAFSVICLADNGRSPVVRNLFGAGSSNEGLGLLSFGFDWTLITQAYPLYWPLQTQISSWIGILLCYVLMMACYYGDVFQGYSRGIPFMSTALFSGNGSSYDQSAILNSNNQLDPEKYAEIGPPFMTTTYAVSLLVSYGSTGAAFSHIFLWHWKELWQAFKGFNFLKSEQDFDDVHFQKMKSYPEVPQLWYGLLFLVSLALAIGMAYVGTNTLPWWSVIVFTIIAFILAVILGFVNAVTGFSIPTDGIVQVIAAYVHPQQPVQNMYAKLYGYNTGYQTLYMLSDLKLGQYAKVPPRATFVAQLSGTILGSIFNYILYKSIVDSHRSVLINPIGTRIWSGWGSQELNSAAITWGALSAELYSPGKTYSQIPLGLLYGFLAPFPLYIMHRLFPKQWIWSYLNMPIIFTYMGWLPYSVNGMWWPGFVIGLFTQWWVRTRRPKWYKKYNYLTSAALDGGSSIIYFILNFAVFGASGNAISFPIWWGNPDPNTISVDHCMMSDA